MYDFIPTISDFGKEKAMETVKNPPAMQETQIGKIPCRREWQPTPVLLPREFHGHRNLAGYSPWGCKESDMTEQLTYTRPLSLSLSLSHTHTHTSLRN